VTSRPRRRSPPFKKPRSRSGGRSSRKLESKLNDPSAGYPLNRVPQVNDTCYAASSFLAASPQWVNKGGAGDPQRRQLHPNLRKSNAFASGGFGSKRGMHLPLPVVRSNELALSDKSAARSPRRWS
jgi:hypothetical protein